MAFAGFEVSARAVILAGVVVLRRVVDIDEVATEAKVVVLNVVLMVEVGVVIRSVDVVVMAVVV